MNHERIVVVAAIRCQNLFSKAWSYGNERYHNCGHLVIFIVDCPEICCVNYFNCEICRLVFVPVFFELKMRLMVRKIIFNRHLSIRRHRAKRLRQRDLTLKNNECRDVDADNDNESVCKQVKNQGNFLCEVKLPLKTTKFWENRNENYCFYFFWTNT